MGLTCLLLLAAISDVHAEPPKSTGDEVRRVLTFKDSRGENRVEWTVGPTKDGEDGRARAMSVAATWRKDARGRFNALWSAKDFVNACEFDLTLELLDVQVTDLDDDGEGEVSFVYRQGCRSDVSPLTLKLLLYEGAAKYALRGETRERVSEKDFAGGAFKADPAFDKAPKAFLEFAKRQWAKHVGGP